MRDEEVLTVKFIILSSILTGYGIFEARWSSKKLK